MKPIVYSEAIAFLKKQAAEVSKQLTKEHHEVIDMFLDYKQET